MEMPPEDVPASRIRRDAEDRRSSALIRVHLRLITLCRLYAFNYAFN